MLHDIGLSGESTATPAVSLNHVVKHFGRGKKKKTVLKDITFSLEQGEILCLLSPSGGGKTTTVNLIMGNELPDSGQVRVFGEQAPYSKSRKRIGYMPQDEALYNDITAIENLEFFGRMNGMKAKDTRERAEEMLKFGRLESDGHRLVSLFSGGMQRRLSLGVALMHNPDLLLLDEPTVGLDPDHRRRIWNSFEDMAADGKTILVTTHVMDEAERCSRIAMIYEGRIIATGSPAEIKRQTGTTALEDAFLTLENDYQAHETTYLNDDSASGAAEAGEAADIADATDIDTADMKEVTR